jgi:hypothetical protein
MASVQRTRKRTLHKTIFGVAAASAAALFFGLSPSIRAEQRNEVSFRQDKYNESFFYGSMGFCVGSQFSLCQ